MLPRAAVKRVLLIAMVGLVASLPSMVVAQSTGQPASILVCRANVSLCQTSMTIPVGGTVTLDLRLLADSSIQPVVAWETHYQVSNSSIANVALDLATGKPVKEQGEVYLILEEFSQVGATPVSTSGQYYTVQNGYNSSSGQIDYSVTLAGQNTSITSPVVQGGPLQPTVVLGQITLNGLSPGISNLTTANSPQGTAQVITRSSSGQLVSTTIAGASTPATIIVGPVATPSVRGSLGQRPSSGATVFPSQLSLSFWPTNALPPWQGGADSPAATFQGITTNSNGEFSVDDIAPSIVPPGVYDLRVKGGGTLTRVLRKVAVPSTGVPQPIISIDVPYLQPGDLDGSNVVDTSDVQGLQAGFGQVDTRSSFNAIADFTADGIIDTQDFSLLSRNFGSIGE